MAQVVSLEALPESGVSVQTLGRLLGEHQAARAEREPAAPNHVPTSLIALGRLGATPETLGAYAALHRLDAGQLPPPVSPGRVAREDWRSALGDPTMEQAYRAYFEAELVRLGRDALLREYLPDLMEGCGGGGFHPMIRLALGIKQGDESEIVLALAYWATAFLALGRSPHNHAGREDPRGVLERLRWQLRPGSGDVDEDLETGIGTVGTSPAFRTVLHWLQPDEFAFAKMVEASLALFVVRNDASALHVLAATSALRALLPWLYDPTPSFRFYWQAVAAAYLVMGSPSLPSVKALRQMADETAPPWPVLREAAIASLDDHVIQAVYCCAEEETATGNHFYRVAAARFVAGAL